MPSRIIKPHDGPQTAFLSSPADIVIYGGAAGGGKSYALVLDAGRYVHVPGYEAILFRRTTPQLRRSGGLWDTSSLVYPHLNGHPNNQELKWRFPAGSRVSMTHIEHEKDLAAHDGAQYAYIGFDEMIHFPEKFFWYLFSRNRSVCGVSPVVRAATNPCPRSHPTGAWLRELVDWWVVDEEHAAKTGLIRGEARHDRSGVIRYLTRDIKSGEITWVEPEWRSTDGDKPISFTFIPAKLEDNHTLMERDKKYRQNLNMLDSVDRRRLKGNWDAEYEGGMFKAENFEIVDDYPSDMTLYRYWDKAATEPSPKNPDPDWTAGALGGMHNGNFFICDMEHFQDSPGGNERRIRSTTELDGVAVEVWLEQEPGSAGKNDIWNYASNILQGFTVNGDRPDADKVLRAKPWCAASERGQVKLVRGRWNRPFINEATSFPYGKRDQIDAASGLYKVASGRPNIDRMEDMVITIDKIPMDWGFR